MTSSSITVLGAFRGLSEVPARWQVREVYGWRDTECGVNRLAIAPGA